MSKLGKKSGDSKQAQEKKLQQQMAALARKQAKKAAKKNKVYSSFVKLKLQSDEILTHSRRALHNAI